MKERDHRKKHKDKANTRMNIFTLLMGSRKILNILKRPYNIFIHVRKYSFRPTEAL